MRGTESGKAFAHHVFGGVDQLLHLDPPHLRFASASAVLDQSCDFLRELAEQRVKLVVLLLAAKIGQHQGETAASLAFFQEQQPPRMRAVIGFEEPVPLLRREMADLDDGWTCCAGIGV